MAEWPMALDGFQQGAQSAILALQISVTTDLCTAGSLFPRVSDHSTILGRGPRTTEGSKKTRRGRKCLGGCTQTPTGFSLHVEEGEQGKGQTWPMNCDRCTSLI